MTSRVVQLRSNCPGSGGFSTDKACNKPRTGFLLSTFIIAKITKSAIYFTSLFYLTTMGKGRSCVC